LRSAWRFAALALIVADVGMTGCSPSHPSVASGASRVLLVCNGSTERCPRAAHYTSVQAAVNAASPGNWILIWPGVYHENDTAYHAGVWITTPDLHLRGLSRAGVVIDGSHGNASDPCPSSPALQDLAPRNGIVAWKANGVSIQNLTVCDYLSGPGGEDGNEIWWNGGDATGKIGIRGFEGAYLTATSMYHPANLQDQHLAQFGIFAGNAVGPGEIIDSYASNMAAGAFYVGACRQACDTVLTDDHGTNSALGYLGTNSGGRLVIKDSVFDHNRTGIAPTSLNNDDGPPPQDGLCPRSPTKSCTLIENNQITDNNNADAPTYIPGPAVGVGIDLEGAQFDTITANTITGNKSWGIIASDTISNYSRYPFSRCQGGQTNGPGRAACLLPARGNMAFGNYFAGDGTFGNPGDADLATVGLTAKSAMPRNCFYANRTPSGPLTSVPPGIEDSQVDGPPCNRPGSASNPMLSAALTCASLVGSACSLPGRYPSPTRIDYAPVPALQGMQDPCSGAPRNEFCPGSRKREN
jgi:hypothetical protein